MSHTLSFSEAVQAIWRSALVALNMKGTRREYSLMAEDKFVGEVNPLGQQILEASEKVRKIEKINGVNH
mgnify:CR=1 FL=1